MSRSGGAGPPAGQPLSFKTVPGRNRTQKWQQAKTYNYDGDDWGGYDPYDEYAGYDAADQPAPSPAVSRPNRATSFDRGDERRNFSAGAVLYEEDVPESATAIRADPVRTRLRDFTSPEQVPPPLNTRGSPSPVRFPPRKSSITSDAAPNLAQPDPGQAQGRPSTEDKPLPFIRPSDIYKRIAEEREKEKSSLDSSRPSMDSIRREIPSTLNDGAGASSDSLPLSVTGARANLQPLQEQVEPDTPNQNTFPTSTLSGPAGLGDTAAAAQTSSADVQRHITQTSPVLPEVSRISTFGSDFWSGTSISSTVAGSASLNAHEGTAEDIGAVNARKPIGAKRVDAVDTVDLQHQPSVGLRSVVHTAFDRKPTGSVPATPSLSTTTDAAGVGRSDTTSTSSISPIMSGVPTSLNAQLKQQDPVPEVPSTAKDLVPGVAPSQSLIPAAPVGSKPIAQENRPTSGNIPIAVAGFQPGYRRSLDPPSNENSPARTPHVEDSANRRLSGPFAATFDADGSTDNATTDLTTTVSGNSRLSDTIENYTKALPVKSRGRSGTNLSLRESDLAEAISASPENPAALPVAAHAQAMAREQFLREHDPVLPVPATLKTDGIVGTATTSGQESPSKGRVREIAVKYQDIHEASRRGSQATLNSRKSSWSNFHGSEEDLTLKQRPIDGSKAGIVHASQASGDKNMFPKYENSSLPTAGPTEVAIHSTSAERPGVESQQSFRPQIPGGWQSSATTPATEQPSTASHDSYLPTTPLHPAEQVDLTPTTRTHPAVGEKPNSSLALKAAGAALGASLVGNAGLNSHAQDFASKDAPPLVEQPGMQLKPPVGAISSQPPLLRGESDITEAPTSAPSSRPPTPSRKDETASAYADTVAPLKFGHDRAHNVDGGAKLPPVDPSGSADDIKHLSTDTGAADSESDRLRNEIVRSLENGTEASSEQISRLPNAPSARFQSLPEHQRALPLAEVQPRPQLPQRFSWEEPLDDLRTPPVPQGALTLPTITEPSELPEIMPEMPYERPRSKELHIVDNNEDEEVISSVSPVAELSGSFEAARDADLVAARASVGGSAAEVGAAPAAFGAREKDGPAQSYQSDPFDALAPGEPRSTSEVQESDEVVPAGIAAETVPKPPDADRQQQSVSPGQRIPPTREILALKSASDRISAYNHTRRTYAEMDTGLSDWLTKIAVNHHDISSSHNASSSEFPRPVLQTTGTEGSGNRHKHSPSLMNFTNQFRSGSGDGSPSGKRKASLSNSNATALETTPGRDAAGEADGRRMNVDMDKMQQRGKDLIRNANILGGKAQAGAKGLFAKGKSRFGKREVE